MAAADTDFGGQNVVQVVTSVASEVCFILDVPKTAKTQKVNWKYYVFVVVPPFK